MSEIQQKDLVLSPNEFAYVQDRTKGTVSCAVGPYKTSLSQSDALVRFDEKTKRFVEVGYSDASHTFVTAPENWYVILKNPVAHDKHPKPGTSNVSPDDMLVGEKVNITGPVSFALYPAQMARVIRGHRLRSNQYLLARVYNADVEDSASSGIATVIDEDVEPEISLPGAHTTGQLLIIKGTEVSFYIPPTGIEVLPIGGHGTEYVRDAVTLERLEYCILKDEDGNKRYVHGPDVVFPEPTEQFIENDNGTYKFKAIELSKISGIYIKVIADYEEGDETFKVGDELFITGDKQMIYYPRPEHAIIDYGGRIMHFAIAIPAGEGRYVMDRLTGKITIVYGPAMFLPDPRTQVVVKRKLTRKECALIYPNNIAVLKYNDHLPDIDMDANYSVTSSTLAKSFTTSINASDLSMDTFNRRTTYEAPRTLTLDTKFDGVVSIDVWTGYAVNVISKNGDRKVVCGPSTVLLEYDQTLEVLQMSMGKPKTTDNVIETVFLRHENNKVSDIINVTTKDYVNAAIKVSYVVNFDSEWVDKWFSIENYVKFLCDRVRSIVKKEARTHKVEEFYESYADIINDAIFDENGQMYFAENGMSIDDVDILSITVDSDIAELIDGFQRSVIEKSLELSGTQSEMDVVRELAKLEQEKDKLKYELELTRLKLQREQLLARDSVEQAKIIAEQNQVQMRKKAQADLQPVLDEIKKAELARQNAEFEQNDKEGLANTAWKAANQEIETQARVSVLHAIQPDLVAALETKANADMLQTVTKAMAPLAIASQTGVAEVTDRLLRGTPLEHMLGKLAGQPSRDEWDDE